MNLILRAPKHETCSNTLSSEAWIGAQDYLWGTLFVRLLIHWIVPWTQKILRIKNYYYYFISSLTTYLHT
jgi:hypothetical protein